MKRKPPLFAFCVVACCCCHAQQKVAFSYDASGNRIDRAVVINKAKAKSSDTPAGVSDERTGVVDIGISLHPAPVTDKLTISLSRTPDQNIEYQLCDNGGITVSKGLLYEAHTVIDMSGYQPGVYLLHINGSAGTKTWKILKK